MNKQLALAIKLNDEATLADFNWGENKLLQQQINSMLTNKEERLLYLWGNTGSGKTHLLQACCQAVSSTQSAIYLPLALLKEWGPQTIEGLEDQELICIDDINLIAKDSAWEEALFHLYNKVKDMEKSILIISGNQSPTTLPIQLADLRSRLSWGLVIQLMELNDEDKINTLKLHALKRGFALPTSVGQFLLNRCSRNMHDLHHLLNRLDDASLAAQRKITIPFVKDILNI
ncbi:DnaA regulatory inactivator Hda [Fluoribacter dumoffii]|uniref:DnaA-homolog protein hda n=1 Tax=Fluoribacter dumoffii TaxID=463 RepID=A0A377G5T3_9GAMM|nr:DnaA regulatory inactivator Hda [Fluoribacter dumoffii]KTC91697.1 ATPase regulatory factor involved in DnaA inactivation [Fluoribacter dumoffii NY 23]MCW8387177.1 DnaA regulatory inactivator Hda [Fluoribacter dumoffii]MCW8417318.1 DnaA regulatory inactivator Hda [Fluoribacter dumoffii]MCW8454841.1 DnaA regulatory inactivator Hda [Fluoribacter dumoffii]MCW8461082.1 DnaA regulatory inactivator Hda [Fluoribacter dumoffii]